MSESTELQESPTIDLEESVNEPVKILKEKKPRTKAQIEAMENARQKMLNKANEKKKERDEEDRKTQVLLEAKLIMKAEALRKKKEKKAKMINDAIDKIPDNDEDEEVVESKQILKPKEDIKIPEIIKKPQFIVIAHKKRFGKY